MVSDHVDLPGWTRNVDNDGIHPLSSRIERSMPGDQVPVHRPSPLAAIAAIIEGRRIPEAGAAPSPHESRATGVLRPVVFGGNDGLVSNPPWSWA